MFFYAPPPLAACVTPTIPVARREPYVTKGPTEVVVGLYVQGGAFVPGCRQEPRGPYSGRVMLVGAAGKVVARETLHADGRLFVLRVAPGKYTIEASRSGLRLMPATVVVRAGETVRRDLFEDVP